MITIVDYGMGNLRSVSKAFEHIGADVTVTNAKEKIRSASALVVPGVGAFGDCIKNLNQAGLLDEIKNFIKSGKPYLGLCLGMQILFESSEEAPGVPGLGIIAGTVKKFSSSLGLKIPHMGWNQIKVKSDPPRRSETSPEWSGKPKSKSILSENIPDDAYVYFVHSYYVEPKDRSVIAAETDYGISFCSSVAKDNIWATQFHPEKSQKTGLQILKNYANYTRN
jgi:glutamine amidotransferase